MGLMTNFKIVETLVLSLSDHSAPAVLATNKKEILSRIVSIVKVLYLHFTGVDFGNVKIVTFMFDFEH